MRNTNLIFLAVFLILGGCAQMPYNKKPLPISAEILFKKQKYQEALTATLENEQELNNLVAQKFLLRINDRLVKVQGHLQKSVISLMENNIQEAQNHVEQALELYPDHRLSQLMHQALSKLTPKLVSPKKIKSDVGKKPKEKKPDKEQHQNIETKSEPVKIVRENREAADRYLNLGQKNFKTGNLELARTYWRQALVLAPSHKAARVSLIQLLTKEGLRLFGQGELEASIQRWKTAQELDPENEQLKNYLKKARLAQEKIKSIPTN